MRIYISNHKSELEENTFPISSGVGNRALAVTALVLVAISAVTVIEELDVGDQIESWERTDCK